MQVILYIPPDNVDDAHRLELLVNEIAVAETMESYRSLESLALRLTTVSQEETCIVLFARDREDMQRLESMREGLWGHPVFLVIPDQNEETIARAHLLRPRFITTKDSDYADLGSVLGRKLSALRAHTRKGH